MNNQQSEYVWKPGKSGNIEFCGNWKRLQEKEPIIAALIFGHESHEGFETQDDSYNYKIYHSQYGYSVGRRKKQSTALIPSSSSNTNTDEDKVENQIVRALENHIKKLENLTSSEDNLIYCLCANSNTDTDSIREKIIKQ